MCLNRSFYSLRIKAFLRHCSKCNQNKRLYIDSFDCFYVCSPSRPKPRVNLDTLSLKKKYLKLLVKFYKNRISWLSMESRGLFGVIKGQNVAILVENSAQLGVLECGHALDNLKQGLGALLKEQLVEKDCVHLIKFGSSPSPSLTLPFNTSRTQ